MRTLFNAGAVRPALISRATRMTARNKPTSTGKGLITTVAALALMISALAVRASDNQPSESQPGEARLLASGLMGTI
ncbi:hypothetical protein ABTM18_20125, partial [Acinetobacter baumannii]